MSYNQQSGKIFIQEWFEKSAISSLSEFISIPNLSRSFDKDYKANGLLEKAGLHIKSWIESLNIKGLSAEFMQPQDLTPLLLVEIEGQIKDQTILFYGHFDKQPHSTGWDANKGPTTPVIQNNRLYGRGGVDDGFSAYSAMLAIKALQQQGIPLPKIILIEEGDEESGNHIDSYLQRLKGRLGKIDVIIVLDCDIVDYERFWIAKSIRGALNFELRIKILTEGVHSGDSSGIVPSAFKIANLLLSRLQNLETGEVHEFFQQNIPTDRYAEFYESAQDIGLSQFSHLKIVPGLQTVSTNPLEVLINRGWKPTLTVIGLNGFSPVGSAGNVMLPEINLAVSIRIPPTFTGKNAEPFLRQLLTTNTPFGASVYIENYSIGEGWNATPYEPWLEDAIQNSGKTIFGSKAYSAAEGGSIPVVSSFAKGWPKANIIVTGAVGPNANAHGPNQFLDLPYTVKITRMLASIVAKSSQHYLSEKK